MLLALALPLMLASPSTADAPANLFVFAFRAGDVDAAVVRSLERGVVEEAADLGFKVLGAQDVQGLLDAEATRQAAGCDANVECLADIAGSLGAELIVTGDVSKVAGRYLVSLSMANQQSASILGRESAEAARSVELGVATRTAARRLLAPHAPSRFPTRAVLWTGASVATVAGVIVGVVGVLPYVEAQARASDAATAGTRFASTGSSSALRDLEQARLAHDAARSSWNEWGAAAVVAGGALVVAGVGLATAAVLVE